MSRRKHICDVPGCCNTRQRWQRICEICYGKLPREVRNNLIRAYAEKRMADWRSWKRKAGEIIAARRAAPTPSTRWTPQRAFDLQARMLGERKD